MSPRAARRPLLTPLLTWPPTGAAGRPSDLSLRPTDPTPLLPAPHAPPPTAHPPNASAGLPAPLSSVLSVVPTCPHTLYGPQGQPPAGHPQAHHVPVLSAGRCSQPRAALCSAALSVGCCHGWSPGSPRPCSFCPLPPARTTALHLARPPGLTTNTPFTRSYDSLSCQSKQPRLGASAENPLEAGSQAGGSRHGWLFLQLGGASVPRPLPAPGGLGRSLASRWLYLLIIFPLHTSAPVTKFPFCMGETGLGPP